MGMTVDAQLSLDPLAPLDPLAAPPLRRRLLSGLSVRLRRLQSLLLPPFLAGRKLKQDLLVESGVMEDPLAAFYDPSAAAAFGLPADGTTWAVGSELPVPAIDERASLLGGPGCLPARGVGWLGRRAQLHPHTLPSTPRLAPCSGAAAAHRRAGAWLRVGRDDGRLLHQVRSLAPCWQLVGMLLSHRSSAALPLPTCVPCCASSCRSSPPPPAPPRCSWLPLNYTTGEVCQMTNTGDLPETFLLVSQAAVEGEAAARLRRLVMLCTPSLCLPRPAQHPPTLTPPPTQGDFEELRGYEEDCADEAADLPELAAELELGA